MEINETNILDFLRGFNVQTKEEVINQYIRGTIDKDEFIRRMSNAKD